MQLTMTNEQYEAIKKDILKNTYDSTFEKKKLQSYLGESLYKSLKKHKAIIAGGMISSIFTNKDINDVDVYFRNNELLYGFAESNLSNFIISHTKKATQFLHKASGQDIAVQMIHYRYYDNAEEIFNTYDFTVCMGAFDFETEEFILHPEFLKHNSQRILKFNSKTDYPIISAIRVQKYENKGYKISKPEFIRIMMTCMTLNISSYDDLKEHLGGMYGANYDRLFEDVKDDEFDLTVAIDKIANITITDDYFKEWQPVEVSTDDILDELDKSERVIVNLIDGKYRLINGELDSYRDEKVDKELDVNEYFEGKKFYKFVKKHNDELVSFYRPSFKYEVGEAVKAEKEYRKNTYGSDGKLFFNLKDSIKGSTYFKEKDKALIEVEIKGEDVIKIDNREIHATQCKVLREVPEEEWKQWMVEEYGVNLDSVPLF